MKSQKYGSKLMRFFLRFFMLEATEIIKENKRGWSYIYGKQRRL